MTKKELIDLLKDYPDETPIVIWDDNSRNEKSISRIEFLNLILSSDPFKLKSKMSFIRLVSGKFFDE